MKKLFVLGLVLAISSAASATLTFELKNSAGHILQNGATITPSDVVTISIIAQNQEVYYCLSMILLATGPSTVSIANATNVVVPGGIGDITGYEGFDVYRWAIWAALDDSEIPISPYGIVSNGARPIYLPDGPVVSGITFHCDGPGDVTIHGISAQNSDDYGTIVIHQVPEPVTVGLLGLGGLFLRRQRRE